MRLGLVLRTMGEQATRETLLACARTAEAAGLDEIWAVDHIAIPPDDAGGSGGRYLDPLTALAWLAGATERIGLGTAVLVVPYRPALPTAKAIATLQELSGGRLALGLGVGWMAPEFRALGVPRERRGRITDETLARWGAWFADDHAEANGQPFLFRPRPPRPPFFIGGEPPQALERAVRLGDGWMPMGADPEKLRPHAARLHALAAEVGRAPLEIAALGALPLADPPRARAQLEALAALGVTRVAHGARYAGPDEFAANADKLAALRFAPGRR
jgi:probable F420-dependent oxidoreductase